MRTVPLSFAFILVALAISPQANSATCDAGHGCKITCKNGCLAVWLEPNGPCTKECDDSKALGATVNAKKMSVDQVMKVLSRPAEKSAEPAKKK